jgi:hypothetical protein
MPPRDLTAKDIAGWPTPGQAAQLLIEAYNSKDGYAAKHTLLGRLRGGMVQAVSDHSVIGGREGTRGTRKTFFSIPADDWLSADSQNLLWVSSDFEFDFVDEWRHRVTTRHYGVRFEPQGIQDIIKSVVATPTTKQNVGPETKGPRVADAHLKAWFEFYKAVHPPSEDTEDRALEFARQCFPGKSVSRDRVRELRGNVKRGPKVKPT